MTPEVLVASVSRKALWLAAAAVAAGFVIGPKVGAGVACGAALGVMLLQLQAKIVGLCSASNVKRWRRRLGLLWLLKYPALLAGLYLLVNHAPVNVAGFAVGLGLVPAALLVHALSSK